MHSAQRREEHHQNGGEALAQKQNRSGNKRPKKSANYQFREDRVGRNFTSGARPVNINVIVTLQVTRFKTWVAFLLQLQTFVTTQNNCDDER
jgi:hypothetical protein